MVRNHGDTGRCKTGPIRGVNSLAWVHLGLASRLQREARGFRSNRAMNERPLIRRGRYEVKNSITDL